MTTLSASSRRYVAALLLGAFLVAVTVTGVQAQTCPPSTTPVAGVCVASNTGLSQSEVIDIVGAVLGWMAFMFGSVAVIIFVVCGLRYLLSAGDESVVKDAKNCMKWALIGVFVAGGAFIIVKSVAFFLSGIPPVF